MGLKFDDGKLDWTLLPFGPLEDVVRVLEFGQRKYDRDNWQLVDDSQRRYMAALFRHLVATLNGEIIDPETGLSHMSHVACNALFLRHFEIEEEKSNDDT
jgi:hypothetical protein